MAETMLERKDVLLDFGTVAASGSDVVKIGETSLGGFDIVITPTAAVGTASAFTVEASDTEGSGYATVATSPSKTYAEGEVVRVNVPRGTKGKFYRVKGPAATAYVDTYVGK